MIIEEASAEEILQYAIDHQHMKTLKECGIEMVEQGITTIEDLRKVAYYS